eukprot:CAMPEP_0179940138 /NCGR_PEP_ID=MMETSP0983-20121128/16117_1 /TAXON_ID=483367 /ORGANISM="non described non described, Strain CCMP 2436" /LENGTH=39 /DNA_ID= /DNA_START= /DNA_END= /DNA_ORIENTATION=
MIELNALTSESKTKEKEIKVSSTLAKIMTSSLRRSSRRS